MLTQKQVNFARYIFDGLTQRDAWIKAGYSSNYAVSIIDIHACALANSDKVKIRLAALNEKADDKTIMPVKERKKRLSTIANSKLQTPTLPREAIMAIAELNKMEDIYAVLPQVNDNRVMNIIVIDGETKELIDKVKERTRKLIEGST